MLRKTLYKTHNYFAPVGLAKPSRSYLIPGQTSIPVASVLPSNPAAKIVQEIHIPHQANAIGTKGVAAPAIANINSSAISAFPTMPISGGSGIAPIAEIIPQVPPTPGLPKNAPGNSLLLAGLIGTATIGFLVYVAFFWNHSNEEE